jgi:hypothetical protein
LGKVAIDRLGLDHRRRLGRHRLGKRRLGQHDRRDNRQESGDQRRWGDLAKKLGDHGAAILQGV